MSTQMTTCLGISSIYKKICLLCSPSKGALEVRRYEPKLFDALVDFCDQENDGLSTISDREVLDLETGVFEKLCAATLEIL